MEKVIYLLASSGPIPLTSASVSGEAFRMRLRLPEMFEQAFFAVTADPGDLVELGGECRFLPQFSVKGHPEAMGFVPDPHQKKQDRIVGRQQDRVFPAGFEELFAFVLFFLGDAKPVELLGNPELAGDPHGHAELALAAIDDEQVGQGVFGDGLG